VYDGGCREDATLLAGIAAGDQDMLVRLIARHGRGMRSFATRYLGTAGDAEEVVQDVFVTVWKHAARFDPSRGRVSPWLYKITANRCIDYQRRSALRGFMGLNDVEELIASDTPDAEAAISAKQQLVIVRDGISLLPERQRMALLLKVVADLDTAAIADVMGGSPGSVEQLLVRARRGLREHISARDNDGEGKNHEPS
jgi:RNA polymerase sigma-70 factor (ECF subfamily)